MIHASRTATLLIFWTFLMMAGPAVFAQYYKLNEAARIDKAAAEKARKWVISQPGISNYHDYDVKFYHLDLHLESNSAYVEGKVSIQSRVTSASLSLFAVELIPALTIDSVKVNDALSSYTRLGDSVFVELNPVLNGGTIFTVQFFYHGTPPGGGFFSGLSSAYYPSWDSRVTWSLSEPWLAKEWWPAKQDLGDKADSAYIFVTTDTSNKVGSNGLLDNIVPLPNGKHRFEWKTRYPINYYLISVSVADYAEYNLYANPPGLNDSILIQNYLFDKPACLATYKQSIDLTDDYIELFSGLFGMYPFWKEKYGHCIAYLGGAMEHQTMTTTGDFNPHLISHELTHQWFGDAVTCATWNDIWINEGFATYGTYLAQQYLEGQASADANMVGIQQYVMSEPGGSVYIPINEADNIWRVFDGRLSYNKGAAILHMIRFEMNNDSLFFTTLRNFVTEYGDSVATGADFRSVAENTSGLSLGTFFDQWYFGEGYPIYDINYLKTGDTLFLRAQQSTSTNTVPFFYMPIEMKLLFPGGDTLVRLVQNTPVTYFQIPTSRAINGIEVDPKHWSLLKVGSIHQGIGEMTGKDGFLLYPNPVSDVIRLEFLKYSSELRQINIFNVLGKKIYSTTTSDQFVTVDCNFLPEGVYFIRVNSQHNTSAYQIVKQ